jgi:quercetin dioxygenase-like cupin family protein
MNGTPYPTGPGHIDNTHAMPADPLPLPIQPAPDLVGDEIVPLLEEPFASAWAGADEAAARAADAGRGRLLQRLSASRQAAAAMVTVRPRKLPAAALAEGVVAKWLYTAPGDRPLRPGEPLTARLIEMQPGSRWSGPADTALRECLVLRGALQLGDEPLQERDHRVVPAGQPMGAWMAGADGAWLFLRESAHATAPGDTARTVRDAEAGWPEFAPGIRRRVLWQRDGQAAMLYLAEAGAMVPTHRHGHDEECLMVQGELFLDDLLLQPGDYQLAPAGTGHRITETDTGVVIYAHGDLDLQFTG